MLCDEQIVTFSEATKVLPKVNGHRPHASTIWRWARKGVHGIRLETRRLGGRFVTSIEALDRFSEALAAIDLPDSPKVAAPKHPTNKQRERSVAQATRTLAGAGIL